MPNAECERKFSGSKNCKTYLRNSMGQNRLNHLMLMNNHQEKAEKSSNKIAHSFVCSFLKISLSFFIQGFV